jgi:hypothetical protein
MADRVHQFRVIGQALPWAALPSSGTLGSIYHGTIIEDQTIACEPHRREVKGIVVEHGRTTYDPDLDLRPRLPERASIEPIESYQRLVANPFLAVLAWVVAFGFVSESMNRQNLALFMMGIILLFVAFFFLHFHCLDCGATGWLLRSWAHACPAVVARRQSQLIRRFHGPGLTTQLAAWFIVIMATFLLGMIALGAR